MELLYGLLQGFSSCMMAGFLRVELGPDLLREVRRHGRVNKEARAGRSENLKLERMKRNRRGRRFCLVVARLQSI